MMLSSSKSPLLLSLCLLLASMANAATSCVDWSKHLYTPTVNPATGKIHPDMGLYWFKNKGDQQTVMRGCHTNNAAEKSQCMAKLTAAGFFNTAKPTIIFIHGWQPFKINEQQRFDFCLSYQPGNSTSPTRINALKNWHNWNVAVFYWDQFADEMNVVDAENKIYTTKASKNIRWHYIDQDQKTQYCNVNDSHCYTPSDAHETPLTIAQMALQTYQQAMPSQRNYHQQEIRLTGQSLGTQVAIQLALGIAKDPTLPQINRLSLFDPFFSNDKLLPLYPDVPKSTADTSRDAVYQLRQINNDLPMSFYRTTTLSSALLGNDASHLLPDFAFIRLYPKFMGTDNDSDNQGILHLATVYLYFDSIDKPIQLTGEEDFGSAEHYINAAASAQMVRKLRGHKRYQAKENNSVVEFEAAWSRRFWDAPH